MSVNGLPNIVLFHSCKSLNCYYSLTVCMYLSCSAVATQHYTEIVFALTSLFFQTAACDDGETIDNRRAGTRKAFCGILFFLI